MSCCSHPDSLQVGSPSFRVSSACSCISTSTTSVTSAPTSTEAACAVVSSLSAAQIVVSPSGTSENAAEISVHQHWHPIATPTVPAQLAHDCLNSVLLGKESALELVESIEPYLEFQSGKYPAFDCYISRTIKWSRSGLRNRRRSSPFCK